MEVVGIESEQMFKTFSSTFNFIYRKYKTKQIVNDGWIFSAASMSITLNHPRNVIFAWTNLTI